MVSQTDFNNFKNRYSYVPNVNNAESQSINTLVQQNQGDRVEISEKKSNKKNKILAGTGIAAIIGAIILFAVTRGKKGTNNSIKMSMQTVENASKIPNKTFEDFCRIYNIPLSKNKDRISDLSSMLLYIEKHDFKKYLSEIHQIQEPQKMLEYFKNIFEKPVEFKFPKDAVVEEDVAKALRLIATDTKANGVWQKIVRSIDFNKDTPVQQLEKIINHSKNEARLVLKEQFGDYYTQLKMNMDNPQTVKQCMYDISETVKLLTPKKSK